MADLRDQLLKAGLVDKRQKQQADASARRTRRKKRKKKGKGADLEESRQRNAFEARLSAEAEKHRQLERARQLEQERRELERRVDQLAGAAAVRESRPGRRRWCFVTRENRIRWLDVGATIAWQLELGNLAIVERPGNRDEPFAIVPRQTAERIAALDCRYVRFWNLAGSTKQE